MRKDSVGRVWESILSSRVLAEISIYITWHLIQDSGLPANNSENAAKLIWPEDCRMVSLWHEKTSLISTHPSGDWRKEEAISRTSKHFDVDYCSIECWTLGARIDSLKVVTAAVCPVRGPALSSRQHLVHGRNGERRAKWLQTLHKPAPICK